MKFLLTVVYLLFTTSGMFFMKAGGDSLSLLFSKGLEFKIGYLSLVGFVCYGISFLLWQKLLVTYDLSYIVPLTMGIIQIITLVIGVAAFQESISWVNVMGVFCIVVGVILVGVGRS